MHLTNWGKSTCYIKYAFLYLFAKERQYCCLWLHVNSYRRSIDAKKNKNTAFLRKLGFFKNWQLLANCYFSVFHTCLFNLQLFEFLAATVRVLKYEVTFLSVGRRNLELIKLIYKYYSDNFGIWRIQNWIQCGNLMKVTYFQSHHINFEPRH